MLRTLQREVASVPGGRHLSPDYLRWPLARGPGLGPWSGPQGHRQQGRWCWASRGSPKADSQSAGVCVSALVFICGAGGDPGWAPVCRAEGGPLSCREGRAPSCILSSFLPGWTAPEGPWWGRARGRGASDDSGFQTGCQWVRKSVRSVGWGLGWSSAQAGGGVRDRVLSPSFLEDAGQRCQPGLGAQDWAVCLLGSASGSSLPLRTKTSQRTPGPSEPGTAHLFSWPWSLASSLGSHSMCWGWVPRGGPAQPSLGTGSAESHPVCCRAHHPRTQSGPRRRPGPWGGRQTPCSLRALGAACSMHRGPLSAAGSRAGG